ncbi:MAG: TlpA disulfide reductase family protein [Bacteroidales bacterium]|nr:TlpA family protein disulfide reductase [Bacteroidales bacterium]MDD2425749.1 TlpA disulfide reductase family protein [Bacteroidales bacterium]MDD3989529.1 TlpA disulfide reductase family protein [Bacteroidales bacterium]
MKKIVFVILMFGALNAMAQQNPDSQQARMARITSFLNVKGGPEETEAILNSMIKEFPNVNLDMEKALVALAYAEIPDSAKAMSFINSMEDQVYRVGAISMMLDIIAPVNSSMALDIATKELERVKKIKGQTQLSVPLNIDPKKAYDEYINLYGKLLFKAGRNEEAYLYTKEAYNNIQEKDGELIENYAFLSSSLDGNYEEALPVLAKAVKGGKNEKRYIDQVREGYQKLNPGKDADTYIASLQKGFIEKIKSQVEKLMTDEPAPDFFVTDVNGKKVTLADFAGKTIVLDFWATWCGPCVASFPAMQIAVNRYVNDPDVKFLFIHTWENVADPLTDAKQFLSKRNYKFDLYMDTIDPATKRSPAVTAFKATGIPAKFIIDGKGRIRFKLEGFSGTDEAAAEEVVQMVEMARKVE